MKLNANNFDLSYVFITNAWISIFNYKLDHTEGIIIVVDDWNETKFLFSFNFAYFHYSIKKENKQK